nr:MAG TPA: nucelotide kinase [Caudoviricetes sp.]
MNDSAFEEKVNHPSHYNAGRIEVIDFIEDQNLNFNLGNAVKYISRAGKKDPKKFREDLEKAIWYLNRELTKNSEV